MRKTVILTILILLCVVSNARPAKKRVACIGDSITWGMKLENRERDSYPSQLQVLLGDGYEVRNFGKNGATLLRKGHRPYMEQEEFRSAMEFPADYVVIHLGVNDTDPRDWPDYSEEFVGDYLKLIDSLKCVSPDAEFMVALLSPIRYDHPRFSSGTKEWEDEIQDAIRTVAELSGATLIDFHSPLYSYPEHIPDAVHPDRFGAGLLAGCVYSAITGDFGGLKMSRLFTDHMVLQRGMPLTIEGTANAGDRITVKLGKERLRAEAGRDGRWSVCFASREAAEGLTLEVLSPDRTLRFEDVAIGEVWLCSGQSNMRFRVSEMDSPDIRPDRRLRLFDMKERRETDNVAWPSSFADTLDRLDYFKETVWREAGRAEIGQFSAVAYYFGRMLRDSLDVPVGLICNAVGGSATESWIDRQTLETRFPEVLRDWEHNDYVMPWVRGRAAKNLSDCPGGRHPYHPSYLFESGILPLRQFPVRGVLWYQGESNAHNISVHEREFLLLVDSWREWWDRPDLPFYYVQLSSLNRPSWPRFRDSQRRLLSGRPGLGMAVTSDLGDPYDVHYKDKRPVGERLARIALKNDYGFDAVSAEGPVLSETSVSRRKVTLRFRNADGGLRAGSPAVAGMEAPECLAGFELAEYDGLFYPVTAKIEGNTVILTIPSAIKGKPAIVRYGWQPYTRANLYNGAGLPASTFRSRL